jgi:hypothetical protein
VIESESFDVLDKLNSAESVDERKYLILDMPTTVILGRGRILRCHFLRTGLPADFVSIVSFDWNEI